MRFLPAAFLLACAPIRDLPSAGLVTLGRDGEQLAGAPTLLDFGEVSVAKDVAESLVFTLRNEGDETLSVTGHDTPIGDRAFSVHAAPLLELPPGAEVDLDAWFTPSTDGTAVAELHIAPGDASLVLLGRGLAPVARVLDAVVPDSIVGCTSSAFVPVYNDGSEPLVIRGATAEGTDFSIDDVPGQVAPGTGASVLLHFDPAEPGPRSGSLRVSTNDPATPELAVPLAATAMDGGLVTESFLYHPSNTVDVLLLVQGGDDTESLVAQLDAEAADLVDALRDHNVDFQLAALGSDSACPQGGDAWAGLGDSNGTIEGVIRSALTGTAGAWEHDLLGLGLAALENSEQSACLSDFRRESAELHLVLLAAGSPTTSVSGRLAALQSAIGVARVLRASVIAPQGGSCGESADALVDAAGHTGGRILDACEADWAAGLADIVAASEVAPFVTHGLAVEPILGTIELTADGVPFAGWSYDPDTRTIAFDAEVEPPNASAIEVTYVPRSACG